MMHIVFIFISFNILGMQGQLWSETVRTSENFDSMIFPRLLALAERAWHKADFEEKGISDEERKRRETIDWTKFANTLGKKELGRLDELGILYRVPPPGARYLQKIIQFCACLIRIPNQWFLV